jgi:site-specific DNA recombinase
VGLGRQTCGSTVTQTWGTQKNTMKGGTRGRKQARPEAEWIRAQRPELAVVQAELFARAQVRISERASAFVGTSHGRFIGRPRFAGAEPPYLLSGLLECACCGYPLGPGPVYSGRKRAAYYTCSRYHRVGVQAGCHNGLRGAEKALDAAVIDAVAKALDGETVRVAVKDALALLTAQNADAAGRRASIRAELAAISARERKLLDAIADGDGAVAEAIRGRLSEELTRRDRLCAACSTVTPGPRGRCFA